MQDKANKILEIDQSSEGILRLLLNDAKNKNPLSDKMMMQLKKQLFKASNDNSIKVVIISAVGDVFCSGHNLKEIKELSLMQMIISCSKPVIAEINGIATAAGCQLVASCDLAIASDSSKFATPGVNIGLFCSTPMVALSRNVSKKDSMKMLLTGDMVDAVEAKRISLINDHVPDDKLNESVMSLAKKIATKPLSTVKIGKDAFYRQYEMSLSEAYEYTSKVMTINSLSDDAKEGITSFLEKRDPVWKDD